MSKKTYKTIKSWRKGEKITYDQMAFLFEISRSYAFQLCSGERMPGRELAKDIEFITSGLLEAKVILGLGKQREVEGE